MIPNNLTAKMSHHVDKIAEIMQQMDQIDEQIALIEIDMAQHSDLSKEVLQKKYETIANLKQQRINLDDHLNFELNESKVRDGDVQMKDVEYETIANLKQQRTDLDDDHLNFELNESKVRDDVQMKDVDDRVNVTVFEPSGKSVHYNKGIFDHNICYLPLTTYEPPQQLSIYIRSYERFFIYLLKAWIRPIFLYIYKQNVS